jgi:hypothetical protein
MGGFLDRLQGGKGGCVAVHDPLHARVLVLKSPQTSVAIVSIDLIMFSSARVVQQARARRQLDHVLLCSTHTHAGPIPRTGGMVQWSNLNVNPTEVLDFAAFAQDPWFASVEQAVVDAIDQAMDNLFDARLGCGQGDVGLHIAHNRRVVHPDGRVTMLWSNPQRLATAPVDNTVRVLRVDDSAGRLRAVVSHYCCHPVALGPANLDISADFPGHLTAQLEARHEGVMALFLQGAQGDIDVCDTGLSGAAGHDAARAVGLALADKTSRIVESIHPRDPGPLPIRARQAMLRAPDQRRPDVSHELGVTTLLLDGGMAMLSVSGEPFVQHQLDLASRSPAAVTCLLGLAYNGQGVPWGLYLPTVQAAREGGYGARDGAYLRSDTGQRVVELGLQTLHQLQQQATFQEAP